MSQINCTCGAENEAISTFCTECGKRLVGGAAAADPSDQEAAAQADATQLAGPTSRKAADQEAQTRLADAHAEEAAQAAPEKQAVPTKWQVGDVILDLYEVTALLGEGGFGSVHKVHHREWDTDLAVKSPQADRFQTEAQRENFIRECEAWIQLGMHPHVVSCFYVRTIGGVPHVFAEYVEGGNLAEWIEELRLYQGGHDEALRRMLDIAIQFAWGLHYAHEQGLIHQDVKPANVLVTPEGEAKVTDFGGGMTLAYCSPEQATGEKLSQETDIWSWGVSVLEMFTGERTWKSGTIAAEALDQYLKAGASDESIPRMPDAVVGLLKDCFQGAPKDRPCGFQKIADRMRAIYESDEKVAREEYPREKPLATELLADALNNRAVSMIDLGRSDETDGLLDQALNADPEHLEAVFNLGIRQWRLGESTDAGLLRRIAQIGDQFPAKAVLARHCALEIHMERGDTRSALAIGEELGSTGTGSAPAGAGERIADLPSHSVESTWTTRAAVSGLRFSADSRRVLFLINKGTAIFTHDLGSGGNGTKSDGLLYEVQGLSRPSNNGVIISGSTAATAHIWDINSGKMLATYEGHRGTVLTSCLSRDSRNAITAGEDKQIHVWSTRDTGLVKKLEGHEAAVWSVDISDDESHLVSAGSTDCTFRVWDLRNGRPRRVIEGNFGSATCVRMMSDGCSFLAGSSEGFIRLYDTKTGACLRLFSGHEDIIVNIDIFTNGHHFVSSDRRGTVRVWNVRTGRCLRTLDDIKGQFVATAPDDTRIAMGGFDGRIAVRDVKDTLAEREICRYRIAQPARGAEMLSRDRKFRRGVRSLEDALNGGDAEAAGRSYAELVSLEGRERSPQVHRLVETHHRMFDRSGIESVFPIQTLGEHGTPAVALAWSRDSMHLATGNTAGMIRMWDAESGRQRFAVQPHENEVHCLAFLPGREQIVSGSWDGTVKFLEQTTGKEVGELSVPGDTICSLDVSPDGKLVLVGFDHTVGLWRVGRKEAIWTAKVPHRGFVGGVCISPSGKLGASASDDGRVGVWDLQNGTHLRWLAHFRNRGREQRVLWADDSVLSSVGTGGRFADVRIWDWNTQRIAHRLNTGFRNIQALDSSPCTRFLLIGGRGSVDRLTGEAAGGGIKIWDAVWKKWVAEISTDGQDVYDLRTSPGGTLMAAALSSAETRVFRIVWKLRPSGRTAKEPARVRHRKTPRTTRPETKAKGGDMEGESELTVEKGLKKFASPLHLIGIALIWFYLQMGPGLEPDALNDGVAASSSGTEVSSEETSGGTNAAPALAPTRFSVDYIQAALREGAVILNGKWGESPVLASIAYFFMHCTTVMMMIALVLLGKRREPSRGQMTAAYWTGLAIGGALWTVHWGYLLWGGYVAVFITNTGLMTQVVRYSATGRAAVAERARKSS